MIILIIIYIYVFLPKALNNVVVVYHDTHNDDKNHTEYRRIDYFVAMQKIGGKYENN